MMDDFAPSEGASLVLEDSSYQLQEQLGLPGALGRVFRATHHATQEQVAVKIMRPGLPSALQQRFFEESAILRQLASEQDKRGAHYTPRVLAVQRRREPYCIVMELAQGEPLPELLQSRQLLPEPEMLEISAQFAHLLTILHAMHCTYTDMKLDNIFWDGTERKITVIDWNVVEKHDDLGARWKAAVAFDLLRFATYIYRMCTGQNLVLAGDVLVGAPKHLDEALFSRRVDSILRRALRVKRPEDKWKEDYRSAQALYADLQEHVARFRQSSSELYRRGKADNTNGAYQSAYDNLEVARLQSGMADPLRYDIEEELDKAKKELKKQFSSDEKEFELCQRRIRAGMPDAAREGLQKLRKDCPDEDRFYWWSLLCQLRSTSPFNVEPINEAWKHLERGVEALQNASYDYAVNYFEAAQRQSEDSTAAELMVLLDEAQAYVLMQHGEEALRNSDYQQADQYFQQSHRKFLVILDPSAHIQNVKIDIEYRSRSIQDHIKRQDSINILKKRAEDSLTQRDFENAINSYDMLFNIEPDETRWRGGIELSILCIQVKNFKQIEMPFSERANSFAEALEAVKKLEAQYDNDPIFGPYIEQQKREIMAYVEKKYDHATMQKVPSGYREFRQYKGLLDQYGFVDEGLEWKDHEASFFLHKAERYWSKYQTEEDWLEQEKILHTVKNEGFAKFGPLGEEKDIDGMIEDIWSRIDQDKKDAEKLIKQAVDEQDFLEALQRSKALGERYPGDPTLQEGCQQLTRAAVEAGRRAAQHGRLPEAQCILEALRAAGAYTSGSSAAIANFSDEFGFLESISELELHFVDGDRFDAHQIHKNLKSICDKFKSMSASSLAIDRLANILERCINKSYELINIENIEAAQGMIGAINVLTDNFANSRLTDNVFKQKLFTLDKILSNIENLRSSYKKSKNEVDEINAKLGKENWHQYYTVLNEVKENCHRAKQIYPEYQPILELEREILSIEETMKQHVPDQSQLDSILRIYEQIVVAKNTWREDEDIIEKYNNLEHKLTQIKTSTARHTSSRRTDSFARYGRFSELTL